MAFISGAAPNTADDELSGGQETEYAWGFGTGFVWSQKKRTITLHRVFYAIDDTGGETFNATWTVGAMTLQLRSVAYDIGYLDKRGVCVATYHNLGSWAWV